MYLRYVVITQNIFRYFLFFIEKLRLLTHEGGNLSHKGIARRALPASEGKDAVGEIKNENEVYDTHAFSM